VPRRGLFDTYELAERAETQFSDEVLAAMPAGTREDIRAAGRCLAFGLGTATCFHLVRALEAALAIYMEAQTGQPPFKGENLWKESLARFNPGKDNRGSSENRIMALLFDVDSRYRRELTQPHSVISINEAGVFFGMAGSLVTLMLEEVKGRNGNKAPALARPQPEKSERPEKRQPEQNTERNGERNGDRNAERERLADTLEQDILTDEEAAALAASFADEAPKRGKSA
jgi:hypothetical protein